MVSLAYAWWWRLPWLGPNLHFQRSHHLVGLVVKASASRVAEPGFDSRLRRGDFSGSSHTSDLKNDTPVATLPGAWRYRVSAATGWPGVSILWQGEVESLICNFSLSVAARTLAWADLFLRYTSMLLGRWATNRQTNKQTAKPTVLMPEHKDTDRRGAWWKIESGE